MNLNARQLKAIEDFGYRLISPALTAINIDVDEIELAQAIRTPGTQARNAYYRGYLRQTIELREAIIKSAHNGSNPAQTEMLKFLADALNKLKYE